MNRPDFHVGPGSDGDAVRDVQRRLAALGYDVGEEIGTYGPLTEAAVARFQDDRGLRSDGRCGPQTWSSLVEAGYRLGDRLLYLRSPMLRGDDVYELQKRLGQLGFDAGWIDGILGPSTADALARFQRNAGLTTDGICGPDTVEALIRFARHGDGSTTVAAVRATERLRQSPSTLQGRRVVVGEMGGLSALATQVGRRLTDAGADVLVLHHPDGSTQAAEANRWEADAFLSLGLRDEHGCRTAYYASVGFESAGGRRLAGLLVTEIAGSLAVPSDEPVGMRLPILRETRMPAVLCEIGPPSTVVQHTATIVQACTRALVGWVDAPLEG